MTSSTWNCSGVNFTMRLKTLKSTLVWESVLKLMILLSTAVRQPEILNISTRSDLSHRSSSDSVLRAFNLCSYDINFSPFNFFVNLRCIASIWFIFTSFHKTAHNKNAAATISPSCCCCYCKRDDVSDMDQLLCNPWIIIVSSPDFSAFCVVNYLRLGFLSK